jgi:hypothetical protein
MWFVPSRIKSYFHFRFASSTMKYHHLPCVVSRHVFVPTSKSYFHFRFTSSTMKYHYLHRVVSGYMCSYQQLNISIISNLFLLVMNCTTSRLDPFGLVPRVKSASSTNTDEDIVAVHSSQADAYNINAPEGNRRALRLVVLNHSTEV